MTGTPNLARQSVQRPQGWGYSPNHLTLAAALLRKE
eukprot:CAMPEP_0174351154 /NCGR_PEP_ID=MMETSP0811_2-20130205/8398_1 /TAXON_ID=73025 ORGANISM="Eutreptiella gymnastica-like, Strain CCMP1594" /NCGR_SAMPLE_ID=MMETSP0811_2 /ASSEMBLY_ACC=CAM_ASM_000667 /LENGTH=35 /DNA_ID= /DNA_START= /DNA_END= /DNA_ORIENTATION=